MAFNNNPGKQSFTATGGQTEFDFNFKIYADIDLKVYLTPDGQDPNDTTDILTLTTDYTVVVDGDDGGTITLTSGATVDDTIVIARDLDATRDISYVTNGDLKAATLNLDQDYQTYLIIDGFVALANVVQLPQSAVDVDPVFPNVVGDAYLKWNAAGTALENDTTIPQAVIDAAASAAAASAAAASASAASTSANDAQLREWEAEAWRLTADSYANEAEDVPVNIVTSDGDGTFTYTPTSPAEYSALHWATKSESYVGGTIWGAISGTLSNQTDLINALNLKAPLVSPAFTDEPTAPTPTLGDNSTRVATTAFVLANGGSINVASTAEAQAGTDNTKAITPLRLREGLNASGTAPIYACRAWVNFNGTGVVAIRDSGNISSITDNGAGIYAANFISALPDVNYAAVASGSREAGTGGGTDVSVYNLLTTSVGILSKDTGITCFDIPIVTLNITR